MSDLHLSGFSPVTMPFVQEWVERITGVSEQTWINLETAAILFFVWRQLPDGDFPNGKWATIQHLEGLIEAALPPYVAFALKGEHQ